MTTKDILSKLGDNIIDVIKSNLDSSSRIYNNISYNIVENENEAELTILTPDYFKYIDNGRKPNSKLPPPKPIEEWIKRKNIETKAVFAIQKHIAKNGIPAKNITEQIIKLSETSFSSMIELQQMEIIKISIEEIINGDIK